MLKVIPGQSDRSDLAGKYFFA